MAGTGGTYLFCRFTHIIQHKRGSWFTKRRLAATRRCIARTLCNRRLGGKGLLGWGDFSYCTGGTWPRHRQLATPTAGPGQPDPRQTRPRGRPPGGAGPTRTTDGKGGGEWQSGIHLLKCSRRLGGLNEGRGRRAPREGQHRGQERTGNGRQATQTG